MISPALDNLLYYLAEQIVDEAEREEAATEVVADPHEEAENPTELTESQL